MPGETLSCGDGATTPDPKDPVLGGGDGAAVGSAESASCVLNGITLSQLFSPELFHGFGEAPKQKCGSLFVVL